MRFLTLCLGISFLFPLASVAGTDSSEIHSCIQQVCAPTSSPKIGEFLNREKSNHKDLDAFYAKYKDRIEAIRIGRSHLAREAIYSLQNSTQIEHELNSMIAPDLLNYLIELHPWNLKTESLNGAYVVVAEPLVRPDEVEKSALIFKVFEQFKEASPLFSLNMQVDELNADPRKLLNLPKAITLESYIFGILERKLSMLPKEKKEELEAEVHELLPKIRQYHKQYGEKIFTALGDIDLKATVALGEVKLSPAELNLLKSILKDRLSGALKGCENGKCNLDAAFNKTTWVKSCQTAYNRALHYSLTEQEEARIRTMKSEASRRSEKSLTELFGPEMTAKILGYVKTMNLGGPMTLKGYEDFIESFLSKQETLISKRNLTLIEKRELVKDLDRGRDNLLGSICNTWIFEPLRDSVQGKNIILSSFSAKNYEVGLSIAIHELGHAVSSALQFHGNKGVNIDKFMEVRQCMSENYRSSSQMPVYNQKFSPDKLWTEEDWADAFAGYSTRDMKINDMCSFMGVNPDHDFTKLESRGSDPHAPTFYRILNIHTHMGKSLPNQCTVSIKAEFPGTEFRNCLAK